MGEDRLAALHNLLTEMTADFDAAVAGLDAYLEKENPFTPEEVERYDVEFSRLNGAVRQANKELQSFTGWLAGRPGRH